jgi:hypothetical protein
MKLNLMAQSQLKHATTQYRKTVKLLFDFFYSPTRKAAAMHQYWSLGCKFRPNSIISTDGF